MAAPDRNEILSSYMSSNSEDIVVYSGVIDGRAAAKFVDDLISTKSKNKSCLFFLTTYGGDPDAAYRMVKALKGKYDKVRLGVFGPCKSAGTLISLGCDEIIFWETGELGPLDVQLTKPDELISSGSGLDTFQALLVATTSAFNALEYCMLNLVEKSGGAISTKTALETAQDFSVGLFSPITSQIDPNRLGEVQRAIKIAEAYCVRMKTSNLKPKAIDQLIKDYPSHGFVIDFDESCKLFNKVVRPSEPQRLIAQLLRDILRHPSSKPIFDDVAATMQKINASKESANEESSGIKDSRSNNPRRARGRAKPNGSDLANVTELPTNTRSSSRNNSRKTA